ncbi:MAG: DUF1329 domain-containing protein [Deltaproteobacteria bacterium]|nr:DUF1329 domain-containing protein [Deltaproteobacteria bacterium]
MIPFWIPLLAALLVAFAWLPANAEVAAEEAKRLGTDLTPVGAERAGNSEGTIPEWTGGITALPPDYDPGISHPDPFAQDPVLFTIDASNWEQHAPHLTEGQKALLRTHPETWRMPIYRTRRSASYPSWVYDAIAANATRARVIMEGKGGVENAKVSSPFPIPNSGVEVIWNHNLRWRGVYIQRSNGLAAVTRRGKFQVVLSAQEIGFPYGSQHDTPFKRKYPNIMFAIKSKIIAPALLAGNGTLGIETINQTRDPRKVWSYRQSLRRVVRNPFVAYDFPAPNSDNLRTVDDAELFLGPPDRFDWKLLGKRQIYIPYNAYRLNSNAYSPKDILLTRHINPDLARYELHRVWVVEGRLKSDEKHAYSRRVFYVDEDSWQIAAADLYDLDGELWRVAEAHAINFYEVPVHWSTLEVYHDLKARRYLVSGLDNEQTPPIFGETTDPRGFSPNALSYYIR